MALIKGTLFPRQSRRGGGGGGEGPGGRICRARESWPSTPSDQLFSVKAEPVSRAVFRHSHNSCLYFLLGRPSFYCLAADNGETEEACGGGSKSGVRHLI